MPAARRWIRPVFGLVIATGFLFIALHNLPTDSVGAILMKARWPTLLAAPVVLVAGYGTRVLRWWWMLRVGQPRLKLSCCVWPLLASVAVNNILPLRAGDALRVFGFREQLHTPAASLFTTLLIERILDLTILLGFLLTGITGLKDSVPPVYVHAAALIAIAGAFMWVLLVMPGNRCLALSQRICRHRFLTDRGIGQGLELQINHLFTALDIIRNPMRTAQLLILSVVIWSFEGAVFALVAQSVAYDGRPFGPWFALATGTLATLIPSSPGYVGTFDFFTMSGLNLYGASRACAAAVTVLVHTILWLPLTAAGMCYLLLPRSRVHRNRVATSLAQVEERS